MKVCIAHASGGEYDDAWEDVIGVYTDKKTAKKLITEDYKKFCAKFETVNKDTVVPNKYLFFRTRLRCKYKINLEREYYPSTLEWIDERTGILETHPGYPSSYNTINIALCEYEVQE